MEINTRSKNASQDVPRGCGPRIRDRRLGPFRRLRAGDEGKTINAGGPGGDGGAAQADCDQTQVGLINIQDVAASLGLIGLGTKAESNDSCVASANGAPGGYATAEY